jgi:hypothetical protein
LGEGVGNKGGGLHSGHSIKIAEGFSARGATYVPPCCRVICLSVSCRQWCLTLKSIQNSRNLAFCSNETHACSCAAVCRLKPHAIITAVGTKVFLWDVATERWTPDPGYAMLLNDGWDADRVSHPHPGGGWGVSRGKGGVPGGGVFL